MAVVTMKQLLDSGTHFGHQTRRWNPKMKRFIFTDRNGIYIIDLQQTLTFIDKAYEFVKETVAHGGIGAVRRHQEAGAGIRRGRSDPRRHAVREPALAGRHAHQLLHRAQAAAAPQGARGDGADRRLRGPHQEGNPGPDPREEQAGAQPRRYPRHEQGAVGDLGRRHQQGAHRRRRGPQTRHPGHRDPGHQLRSRRGRLPDPGQRRRDPLGRAADQGDRLRGRRGSAGPRRPGPRRRQARGGVRRAARRMGTGAAGLGYRQCSRFRPPPPPPLRTTPH